MTTQPTNTSITRVPVPTSRCRCGIGRCEITPPVGIYHRFWGAASHDRASGIHQPLFATAAVFAPLSDAAPASRRYLVSLDHCLLRPPEMDEVLAATARALGVNIEQLTITFAHTHSGGHLSRARADLPGGDLIGPYLDALPQKIAAACVEAEKALAPTILSYATTVCNMGHNRDYWDQANGIYTCGFNPAVEWNLPLTVIRAADAAGNMRAVVVNYPCHPTTLAWENDKISPDYIGTLRETVERATGVPCLFLLAPTGDIGPRNGYVGETRIAESNGRQVGYAALSALESLPAPATDFHYRGPKLSGATLGIWRYEAQSTDRKRQTEIFRHRRLAVEVPYREDLPTVAQAEAQLAQLLRDEEAATRDNDQPRAAELRTLAERCRRLLERIRPLPPAPLYPLWAEVMQLGDAFFIAVEGEPYHWLQQSLMERFRGTQLLFAVLANGTKPSYLPTREAYAKPLYQVEVTLLAPGCLEALAAALGEQIAAWLGESRSTT